MERRFPVDTMWSSRRYTRVRPRVETREIAHYCGLDQKNSREVFGKPDSAQNNSMPLFYPFQHSVLTERELGRDMSSWISPLCSVSC